MKIKAVIPSVVEEEFETPNEITVSELKRIICQKLNIESNLTQLILNGIPLKDDEGLKAKKNSLLKVTVDYYWARNIILWGLPAQKALRSTSILIAGAGALGCEVAENLAMLGIGKLIIIDYDLIELSNLSRMTPYGRRDLGRPKASVLSDKLTKKYPFVSIETLEKRIEDVPKSMFLDSDIIISCLDNLPSRIYLASLAVRYSIPMVDAGIIGFQGRIQSYLPPIDTCPICIIPAAQYSRLAELRNPCTADVEDEAIPALPTSNKLVASIQSHEALKILLSSKNISNDITGEPLRDALIIDLKYNRFTVLPVKKNKKCLVCGEDGLVREKSIRLEETYKIPPSLEKLLDRLSKTNKLIRSEYSILIEDGALFKKVEKDRWDEAFKLARGKYIYVIFKSKASDEYKEVVVKVHN